MNEQLVSHLRDIHELDPVGWWPPAPGWWLLLLALILAFLVLRMGRLPRVSLPSRAPRWQQDARRELQRLQKAMPRMSAKEAGVAFSELLRRIAVARHGREACAGLVGEDWLAWLGRHDPRGFDWPGKGKVLLDLPYAPPGSGGEGNQLAELVKAAMAWTQKESKQEAKHV